MTKTVTDKGSVQHEYEPDAYRVRKRCGAQGDVLCAKGQAESSSSISSTLAEIRERRSKITRGQWKPFIKNNIVDVHVGDGYERVDIIGWNGFDSSDTPIDEQKRNARFIANAPTDIDTLLGIINDLNARLNEVVIVHEKCYPLVRQAVFEKESAASNMKAEIVKRVRKKAENWTPKGASNLAAAQRYAASIANEIATELEAIEVKDDPGR